MNKTWLFDIDHTIYPNSQRVEDWFSHIIEGFISEHLNKTAFEARQMRIDYYEIFGSTLPGLLYFDQIRAEDFFNYKKLIPLELIEREENAIIQIQNTTNRMIAMTNASHRHGARRLKHLGIYEKFEAIYGIDDMGYWGKPFPRAYDFVFKNTHMEPSETIFFEDSPRNLAYPKRLGTTTILIGEPFVDRSQSPNYVDFHAKNLTEALEFANAL